MTEPEKEQRIVPQPWMVEPATLAVLGALAPGGAEARFVGGSVRDALLGRADRRHRYRHPRAARAGHRALGGKPASRSCRPGSPTARSPQSCRRGISRSRRCAAMSRPTAAAPASPSTPIGPPMPRGATSRSTRSFSLPTGRSTIRWAAWPICAPRRVRFVGDPATRIAEDVLRLLRYYRFEARFGSGAGDPQARAACRAAAHLLPKLSAERVAQELVKLLETPDPIAVLRMMREDGVLAVVLPEARRLDRLRRLIAIEPEADPLRRLAALDRGRRRRCRGARRASALFECVARPAAWSCAALAARSAGRCAGPAASALSPRRRALSRLGTAAGGGQGKCREAGSPSFSISRATGRRRRSRSPGAT